MVFSLESPTCLLGKETMKDTATQPTEMHMHAPDGSRLIDELLTLNRERSAEFIGPEAKMLRQHYRAEHPTEIVVLKCMDGRLNFATMTETPLGIIQPYRNIGGLFDLGWPYFGALIREWEEYVLAKGRTCVVIITYHYSKGDTHRGCRGHTYDVGSSQEAAFALLEQFRRVFAAPNKVFYPFVVGIETDEDALIFHGEKEKKLEVSSIIGSSEKECAKHIRSLFPTMSERQVADLAPLMFGNTNWIQKVRASKRPIEAMDHSENVLGIGRGFDWLHKPNKALIVGPYSYDLADPIGKAAGILLENIEANRISKKSGIVLMSSAVHRDSTGVEITIAREKARSLAILGLKTIEARVPGLVAHLHTVVGTVDVNTRLFSPMMFDQSEFLTQFKKAA